MKSFAEGDRALYDRTVGRLHQVSVPSLRIALGLVFLWFGALKIFEVTPVAKLVRGTVPFIEAPAWVVPALGIYEVGVGLWLISGIVLWALLPVYVAHMMGTFGVLVIQPDVAFQGGNPLVLTAEGEFVVKNLVLLAAGIAVCTHTRRRRSTETPSRGDHALVA